MKEDKIKQSGATLVEVLLVIAIFVIILASAISLTTTQLFESDLDAKVLEVSSFVEKARSNSVSGYQGDVWSIKVLDSDALCQDSGDCILLFKGNDFGARNTSYDRFVQFDSDISGVYIDSNQENEFYFDYSSGWLSTSTATRLDQQNIVLKSNFGEQKSVVVYPSGVVAGFTCGEDKVFDSQGNGYLTVKIGTQCWMAENLNVGTMLASAATDPTEINTAIEKWCYNNDTANCDIYGGLYNWNEAMAYSTTEGAQGICPGAWHIPKDSESDTLVANYPSAVAGYNLKIGGASGFNLPFSGVNSAGSYGNITTSGYMWTSTLTYSSAWMYQVGSADTIANTVVAITWGLPVRCLKDY